MVENLAANGSVFATPPILIILMALSVAAAVALVAFACMIAPADVVQRST
jgi:hypothetical protein